MANKRKRSRKQIKAIHAKKRAKKGKKFSIWAYQNEDKFRKAHPHRSGVDWYSTAQERKKIPKSGDFLPEF